jgi:copper resistance protein B
MIAAASLIAAADAQAQQLGYDVAADDGLAGGSASRGTSEAEEDGPVRELFVDQVELMVRPGREGYAWDVSGRIGGPVHRLYLGSIGEGTAGATLEYLELQAFYSRRVAPDWDLQVGLRYDIRPQPNRAWLAVGAQGSSDERSNLGAYASVSHRGELAARFYGTYDIYLPYDLTLQPSAEINLFAGDIPELGIGRGLGYGEAGLRLRYGGREHGFAPYLGVEYASSFGRTARLAREAGEDPSGFVVLLGVRYWTP